MKWYTKQLKALNKEKDVLIKSEIKNSNPSFGTREFRGTKTSRNPVAQRNRNRSKTDSK